MTHADLVIRAERWLRNTKNCGVVFTERCGSATEIPDAIGWIYGGRFSILVECKTSKSDFYADRRKPFRMAPENGMGQFRYYMTPPNLLTIEMLPDSWGLLEVRGKIVRVIRDARQLQNTRLAEMAILYSEVRLNQIAELQGRESRPHWQLPVGGASEVVKP